MHYQIIALLLWSSSFVAAKYVYTMMDAVWMVQIRLLIAALLVLPVCRRHIGKIPKSSWKALLILAFLHHVAVLLLQFIGLRYTSAASAVTIIGLEPLLMVFVGHFFFKDRARWYQWLFGALAFAGVAVLIAGGAEEGGDISLLGCMLVLLAGVLFAYIWRPTRKLIDEIGTPAYTSVSFLLAVPMCFPFAYFLAESHEIHWNSAGVIGMLYLGIGCSWLAYWLWNIGMNKVSANVSGILTALEPVFGVLLAVLILGEHISALSGAGIALVIAATFLAVVFPRYWDRKQAA
ncbi:drug/metabolite transporter (DMT)-like permease [Neisseria sp. HSC-16F19]|nr:DMT family transporter [Neisseria sp. HSC-16F19]MCP2040521.1 drug/metabolite transporter (DMT)-like permease [Neisseria sp. HSC-16F19]